MKQEVQFDRTWRKLSDRQPNPLGDKNLEYEVLYKDQPIGAIHGYKPEDKRMYMFWDQEEKAFCYDDSYLMKSPKNIKWRVFVT